ncbi:MAG TPA: hypothetical protein VEN81_12500, partial [Planctomycetota bacterium]|nr:hypothetical protein [Planctomycetota bacterium]
FFVGVLGCALWTHLLLLVRIPVNGLTVGLGAVALGACGRWRCLKEADWSRPPDAFALLVGAAGFLLWGAWAYPLIGADAAVFYALKAKSIVVHGGFWNEDFLDPDRLHLAHRRPLLLPSIYANLFLATGSSDSRALRVWFTLLQLGALGGVYDLLRERTGRTESAVAVGLLAWCPVWWADAGGAASGYADGAFGMAVLFSLLAEPPLAVFHLAAGVLLKDEGIAFLIPFALARGVRRAAFPALLAAVWLWVSRGLPRDADYLPANFLHVHLGSLPGIAWAIGSNLLATKFWGLLWYAILGVAILRARALRREDARLLGPLALQLVLYVGVWSTFDPDQVGGYLKVEVRRLLSHFLPTAWVWAVGRAGLSPATDPTRVPAAAGGRTDS